MKNVNTLTEKPAYNWNYSTVGGVTRVNITSGEDIAHLDELDQKLWTVLSCPVAGLECDERTLKLLDTDNDGKIRANEVIAASQWLKRVLVDMDYLTTPQSSVELGQLRTDTEEGKQVADAGKLIIGELKLDATALTLTDVENYKAMYEEKYRTECAAAAPAPYEPPYGEKSDEAEAAVNAVRAKVADWFMRCKLAQFDNEAMSALDVQVEQIAGISSGDLGDHASEIASYPLARPSTEALLPLVKGLNPAWQKAMADLKANAIDLEWEGKETLSEAEWNTVVAKIDAYTAWKAEGETQINEAVAAKMAESEAAIEPVERLLLYCRDFYYLLHNYVVFATFYKTNEKENSIFQAGRLFIDQRECALCVRVSDMGKHLASAGKSGLYLIYCHCTAKSGGNQMDIVAALTDGDVDGLVEGKNAIFYDRNGQDYDAVVTKVIDNPVSIRQAFWSPYRKFGNWVSDKIAKNASEKESKQFEEMTNKAETGTTNLTAKPAEEGAQSADTAKKAMPFDIAKFAGIFAAIGLAFGAIGAALATLGGFVMARWYNVLLLVAAVVLLISGPSMLLAWLKLRKRDLGPVLNANGWAINSKIKINTTFGASLTSMAKYPAVTAPDPFADKKGAKRKRCFWWTLAIVLIGVGVWICLCHCPWHKKDTVPTDTIDTTAIVAPQVEAAAADTTASAGDEAVSNTESEAIPS